MTHGPIRSHHGSGHTHHAKPTDHPHGFHHIKHPKGHHVVIGACKKSPEHPDDPHYQHHTHHHKHHPQQQSPIQPTTTAAVDLPTSIDLRAYMTPIEDQGELGSCTANSLAGAYEYMQKRITGQNGDVSRLFLYYAERKREGTIHQDAGARIRDGIVALRAEGICSEKSWPYDIEKFTKEPSTEAFHEASRHKIDQSFKVPIELQAMQHCLAEGYPIVFGTYIFESFEAGGHHGQIHLPEPKEKSLGAHAMLIVGYSQQKKQFIVRNSWGADWGDNGYCYFPFSYLTNPDYTSDCWTLRVNHDLNFSQNI
jgi:C1A family cysteine protease